MTGENALITSFSQCDLNGDGKDDVVMTSGTGAYGSDGETSVTVHAKRGETGVDFWSQSVTGENVHLVAYSYCDLDGDGKNDVIVESVSYDPGTDETNVTVYAKHGDTGDLFWSQSIAGKDALLGAYPYCDLNGDGKSDVIMMSEITDLGTGEITSTVSPKRGETGVDFWSQSVKGKNVSLLAYSYCDFDGDGKDDVIVESKDDASGGETVATVCIKNGETGTELWCKSIKGEGVWMDTDFYNWYNFYQDFDDDNLEDLLITTGSSVDVYMYDFYLYSIEVPTRVCAVKGSSGTSLWCEPSSETPTPPPVTGDLNGDDAITPADVMIALDIIVSGDYNDGADVNDDGVVNSLDALMILQAAMGTITL